MKSDRHKTKAELISEMQELRHTVGELRKTRTPASPAAHRDKKDDAGSRHMPAPPRKKSSAGTITGKKRSNRSGRKTDVNRTQAHDGRSVPENRFQEVFLIMSDWVWETDALMRCTYCSEKVNQVLDYTVEEMIGKTPFELMAPGEELRLRPLVESIIAAREPLVDIEYWCLSKAGRRVCLATNGVPILGMNGELAGYRGVNKDITGRRQSEEALRDNVTRFEVSFENSPDAIFLVDVYSGTVISCNKKAEQLLDVPREEIIGQHLAVIHPRSKSNMYRGIYSGLATREKIEIEGDVETATGAIRPVHIKGSCTTISGLMVGQVIIRDITERKWAEERLEFLNEQLESIVENIGDGITLSDREGFFLIYNPRMEELTGYSWNEANTLANYLEIISGDMGEYERAVAGIEEAVRTGGMHMAEFAVRRKDGAMRVLSVITTCIRVREREWLLSAYHDITERKWMEQALRDSEMRLKVAADAGNLGLWVWMVDSRDLIIDEQWHRIIGLEPPVTNFTTDWLLEIIHPDDQQHFRKTRRAYADLSIDHNTAEYRVRHPLKKWIWIYMAAQVIEKNQDGSPKRIAGLFQDITDRKHVEEDLKKYRDQLEDLIRERTEELLEVNEHLRAEIADRERAEVEITRLNRHMQDILEQERQRVAKDLHDGVGQTILAAKLNLAGSLSGVLIDQNRFKAGMEYIDRASQELREVYTNLYPSLLGDLGLPAAIRWHARNQLEMNGITVEISIDGSIDVPHDKAVNIYRITQEIFSNILRHSRASRVRVILSAGNGNIALEVDDNGIGFSPEARETAGTGFGLISMKQRAMNMNGMVSIHSLINGGTRISLRVPEEK